MKFRRALAAVTVALFVGSGLAVVTEVAAPAPAEAAVVKKRLVKMTRELKVAREVRKGYDRAKFKHWTDADGDGCNTRYEVLIAEARVKPTVESGCWLSGGRWFSYYDGQRTTNPSDFDVDHMVPLAEAWDSGARRWNAGTRKRFANDLRDKRSLVAVTASSNRSKSDRDPAEWLPPRKAAHCRYAREYVAVKTRWRLTVDRPEKRALLGVARSCKNVVVRVRHARVVLRGSGGGA
ncbi:MAG: HNH endonuclease family protein [Nocardioides sp.]|nr:HNH endonuclease family protein [Nocardioides sp.]